ncbi:MAG: type VI secretion system tip protein VgrG [Saprospiraceae bacterium]|nr:type VI secretion system tip protein VgrG [Saprospiraceae bacterium]MCF8249980.1 type VI secretion system tip protein VgrG [Saprospiraceae bacterium]MCF8278980.1 type VI secretion system tip protein VgrG [Bacteroidales bacterium]MCF8310993.1 type VI secretion system tip protein VgrG [Saprospiraceae bacterium]MCF8439671.1 type VI secretion system tip protein VgrG [Saprospiraceae bacterium]
MPSSIPTQASLDVVTLKIRSNGSDLPDTYQVVGVVVNAEFNRIPTARIVLLDGEAASQDFSISNSDELVPGVEIEIRLGYSAQEESVFKGLVISQNLKVRRNGTYLTIDCKDKAVKATLDRKFKYFREVKDSDMMEELIEANGLQADVEATDVKHKELVQFDATDWDFLMTRTDANGMFCTVNDGSVKIANLDLGQSPVLTLTFGDNILEFDAEMDARNQYKAVKANAWDSANQELVVSDANEPSFSENGNLSASDLADAMEVESFTLTHTGRLESPELQSWADAKLLRQRLSKICGRVTCQGIATVKPGDIIELEGVGERFNGKVIVSAVRQQVGDGNWQTDIQFGVKPDWFSTTYDVQQPSAGGLLPPISGLQIGIVTTLEGDPDGEDRIQVRLPVISSDDEGIWARISTLDAGDKRGTFFRPEIGDEVIVGFLNDDPRHAVVLGMCHSSAKPAPEPPADNNHVKGYVTRSEMKLLFDDEKNIVSIETPKGNRLELTEEDGGIKMEDENGNKITLNSDGILIESAKDIILKAAGDLKIEGVNMELKAQSDFMAEASVSATLKGGATTTVESSGQAVLKGSLVQIN